MRHGSTALPELPLHGMMAADMRGSRYVFPFLISYALGVVMYHFVVVWMMVVDGNASPGSMFLFTAVLGLADSHVSAAVT